MAIAMTDKPSVTERLRDLQSVLQDVFAETQQLNVDLLEALQAVAEADTLDAAQEIACAAIAIAITRQGERDD